MPSNRDDSSERPTGKEKERLLSLFREHGPHRPGPRAASIPLGIGGALVAPGDHLAHFRDSDEDCMATLGFVAAGAAAGEACVVLGHDEANERLEGAMRGAGLDAGALRRQGRLSFVPGRTTADALLARISEQVYAAVDRGAPLVRVLGDLGWGRPGWPADRELLRLEALVTDAVRRLPVVVVCAYDVRGVSGRNLLRGGLECHLLTCRRGVVRRNDLYVPAGPFIESLDAEATR